MPIDGNDTMYAITYYRYTVESISEYREVFPGWDHHHSCGVGITTYVICIARLDEIVPVSMLGINITIEEIE